MCKGRCGYKPAIWIDSGIHPRERISTAVGTWMLHELLENDTLHPDLTENLDWYFLPILNPDGYQYMFQYDKDPRKNRVPNPICGVDNWGIDLNRNFDYNWNDGNTDPCAADYRGKAAFSEIESSNVQAFILARKDNIKLFQTLHSYSQYIIIPNDDETAKTLAEKATASLENVHGTKYQILTETDFQSKHYSYSGDSQRWAYHNVGIPYAYGMELPPDDISLGLSGFRLPPENISRAAEETWAWHEVAARHMIEEFSSTEDKKARLLSKEARDLTQPEEEIKIHPNLIP